MASAGRYSWDVMAEVCTVLIGTLCEDNDKMGKLKQKLLETECFTVHRQEETSNQLSKAF